MQNQFTTTLAQLTLAKYGTANPQQDLRRIESATVERLPFTVKLVSNETEMQKAIKIRHAAYARHVPLFAETLKMPEPIDQESGVIVLLAESKADGAPVGTMRIQTNRFKPLTLERSIKLPSWLAQRPLAEATRLGVTNQKVGRLVKSILFKAFYQYCLTRGIEWMVVTGRAPIDRQYEQLLFEEVYPGMGYIPLQHVGGLPHRILSFEVRSAESRWAEANHPLQNFIFHTHHPDIDIGMQPPACIQ